MIPTQQILTALIAHLTALTDGAEENPAPLFDLVSQHHLTDLPKALDTLRNPVSNICLVIPGPDEIDHRLQGTHGYLIPLAAEITQTVDLILTAQDPSYDTAGAPAVLPLKDTVLQSLLWNPLSFPNVLTLPHSLEPLRLEWDDAPAREAHRLTLHIRQTITP